MWRRIFKVLMLARQVAPLPREFCKDGACFISTNQRGHAFTILRFLKVILNFHTHAARLIPACSQASSTSTTLPPKPRRDCGRHSGSEPSQGVCDVRK